MVQLTMPVPDPVRLGDMFVFMIILLFMLGVAAIPVRRHRTETARLRREAAGVRIVARHGFEAMDDRHWRATNEYERLCQEANGAAFARLGQQFQAAICQHEIASGLYQRVIALDSLAGIRNRSALADLKAEAERLILATGTVQDEFQAICQQMGEFQTTEIDSVESRIAALESLIPDLLTVLDGSPLNLAAVRLRAQLKGAQKRLEAAAGCVERKQPGLALADLAAAEDTCQLIANWFCQLPAVPSPSGLAASSVRPELMPGAPIPGAYPSLKP